MRPRPSVIVFDVNETLSDAGPLAGQFADAGVPGTLATPYPGYVAAPDRQAPDLTALAGQIVSHATA